MAVFKGCLKVLRLFLRVRLKGCIAFIFHAKAALGNASASVRTWDPKKGLTNDRNPKKKP